MMAEDRVELGVDGTFLQTSFLHWLYTALIVAAA